MLYFEVRKVKDHKIIEYGIKNDLIRPNDLINVFVEHSKFGKGQINCVENKIATIKFENLGSKKISLDYIELLTINSIFGIDINSIRRSLYTERKIDGYLKNKYKISNIDSGLFPIIYRIEENDYENKLSELYSLINENRWKDIDEFDKEYLDEQELRNRGLFQVLAIKYEDRFYGSDKINYWLLINSGLYWKKYGDYDYAMLQLKKVDRILDEYLCIDEYKYCKDKSTVYTIIAAIYRKLFKCNEAKKYGQKGINYNDKSFHAHNVYAAACIDLGLRTEGDEHFKIANKLKCELSN